MLKSIIALLLLCSLSFADQDTTRHSSHRNYYNNNHRSGLNLQMGLVIPDDIYPVELGFCFGINGVIMIDLRQAGALAYCPGADTWFGIHKDHNDYADYYHDYYDYSAIAIAIGLNFADFKYYFPVPINVKPFVGMGPMVSLDHYKSVHYYWVGPTNSGYWQENDIYYDWNPNVGFNIMGGIDFFVNPSFALGFEAKGRIADWDLFRLLFNIRFSF